MSSALIRSNLRLLATVSRQLGPNGTLVSRLVATPARRAFSSSTVSCAGLPELKHALFNKLNSEISVEQDSPIKISQEDQSFLNKEQFEIKHTKGDKIVTLTKTLPDDTKLSIFFDCTELNDIQASANQERDVDENSEQYEDDMDDLQDQMENSLLNVNLILENPLTNESLVAHSYLSYDDLEFFPQTLQVIKDNELARSLSAESQQIKLSKYNGPGFQMLDEEVQELFESFFAELGCNQQLGEFIVNYSTVAENDEYIQWLDNLKTFFK